MKSATRRSSLWVSVVVVCVLVAGGFLLSGCAPAPPQPTPSPGPGPQVSPAPAAPEEGAETEAPTAAPEVAEPSKAAEPQPSEPAKPEAADLDLAPPVSTFAPAGDLVAQVAEYVKDLEDAVETEEEYKDSVEKLAKDSNTLILIALALGLHDSDNQHKAAAPAMLRAAQQLAAAEDYAAAKAAVEAFKAATTASDGDPSQLKWGKLASLPEIMKAVPLINTRMKRPLRSESRLERGADDMAGYAAVLAVIAQGSLDSADETEKPDEVGTWKAYCVEMRDLSAAVNAAVRKFGEEKTPEAFEGTKAAMEALNKNCEDCHAVFKPDAVISDEEE